LERKAAETDRGQGENRWSERAFFTGCTLLLFLQQNMQKTGVKSATTVRLFGISGTIKMGCREAPVRREKKVKPTGAEGWQAAAADGKKAF